MSDKDREVSQCMTQSKNDASKISLMANHDIIKSLAALTPAGASIISGSDRRCCRVFDKNIILFFIKVTGGKFRLFVILLFVFYVQTSVARAMNESYQDVNGISVGVHPQHVRVDENGSFATFVNPNNVSLAYNVSLVTGFSFTPSQGEIESEKITRVLGTRKDDLAREAQTIVTFYHNASAARIGVILYLQDKTQSRGGTSVLLLLSIVSGGVLLGTYFKMTY